MFDSPALVAALATPVFIDLQGKTHTGRILGADSWFRLMASIRVVKRADGTFDPRLLSRAMRMIVDAFFPRPWWKFWEKPVSYHVWQLPPDLRMAAVWDFMQSQASVSGTELVPLPGITPPTSPMSRPGGQ
jgi:hypothetical protein